MLHISLCTISFRHQLISLPEIATWAAQTGFDGIELWGAHARNLEEQPYLNGRWLRDYRLSVPMLSDYLPIDGSDRDAERHCRQLCQLAQRWQTTKLRTFAGNISSADLNSEQFEHLVKRLQLYCTITREAGIDLLLETHPSTGADNTTATLRLLQAVCHPALKVNFDVLHIWEAGDNAIDSWQQLAPWIRHMHIKNISHRQHLGVFQPANIYAAAGSREGIVPVLDGCFDYPAFFRALPADTALFASLEWFGNDVKQTLARDSCALGKLINQATKGPTSLAG